jgi:hypothetical protein
MGRWNDRHINGQIYGWTDRWMDRQMDGHTDGWTYRWMDRQTDKERWINIQIDVHIKYDNKRKTIPSCSYCSIWFMALWVKG